MAGVPGVPQQASSRSRLVAMFSYHYISDLHEREGDHRAVLGQSTTSTPSGEFDFPQFLKDAYGLAAVKSFFLVSRF